jgi:DNA helicase-2/ATP-dependent DNA helicase PcrA
MLTMRVPHVLVGGQRFYERKDVKDIVSYLRVVFNSDDDTAFRRVINVPTRAIGPGAIEKLEQRALELGTSLWNALNDDQWQDSVPAKTKAGALRFIECVEEARHRPLDGDVAPVLKVVMNKSDYLDALRAERSDDAMGRLENLQELLNVATEFDGGPEPRGLGAFLEQVALVSDLDAFEDTSDAVTLMTLHSSKGLEFPVVFLVGLEEGVFPHSRSLGEDTELEEERRLCYVGMTRAREELHLTHSQRRTLFGQPSFNARSRFIDDLPASELGRLPGSAVTTMPRGLRGVRQERSGKYRTYEPEYEEYEEVEIEEKPKPSWTPPFNVGQKVQHGKFGIGVVVACSPLKNDAEVTVAFPGAVGVKKLVQSFAKLEVV